MQEFKAQPSDATQKGYYERDSRQHSADILCLITLAAFGGLGGYLCSLIPSPVLAGLGFLAGAVLASLLLITPKEMDR